MKLKSRGLGMILLSLWLILTGLFSLMAVNFAHQGQIMAALAIAAGVFLIVGR